MNGLSVSNQQKENNDYITRGCWSVVSNGNYSNNSLSSNYNLLNIWGRGRESRRRSAKPFQVG